MSLIKIDGMAYNVGEVSLQRNAEIIYDPLTQGVMLDFSEMDDAVATKYTYSFTVEPRIGVPPLGAPSKEIQYDDFYYDITTPKSVRFVELPFGQHVFAFPAKIKTVSDNLRRRYGGVSRWGGLTVTFEPTRPQRMADNDVPLIKQFVLNTLPTKPYFNYVWLDGENWEDKLKWIDRSK